MKWIISILLIITLSSCLSATNKNQNVPVKEKMTLTVEEKKPLIALGQLWGFLKYHHPSVAKGNYDWDMELLKIIPDIRSAKKESEWKDILNQWIAKMPPIDPTNKKEKPDSNFYVKATYGELFNVDYFEPKTIEKVREILESASISENTYVEMNNFTGPTFTNEKAYAEKAYPEYSYRLLALYRYWNIVNYFFPHRELCNQKWSEVLDGMLSDFVYAGDEASYVLACVKLITQIDDSHAFLTSGKHNGVKWELEGVFKVPFETKFVEGQLVVTGYTKEDSDIKDKIKIGDVVTEIAGDSVEKVVNKLLPYTPASNYAVKLREIAAKILRGNTQTISLSILRDGQSFNVDVPRYFVLNLNIPNYFNAQPGGEGYTIIDDSIGYIFSANTRIEERDSIGAFLSLTKGLIVDLRCYPTDFFESELMRYLNKKSGRPTMVSHGSCSYPGYNFPNPVTDKQPLAASKKLYEYKIVVIVNEYTQSWAENTVMVLQNSPIVTVIGSTTAGANGRCVYFDLPGGIRTSITGIGVYYPNGDGMQRTGVKIDEIVVPTIKGIKEGRDELLERAVEIVKKETFSLPHAKKT